MNSPSMVAVSCIYDGYYNTEYGGRPNRKKLYKDSLKSIAMINEQIFCFTSKSLENELNEEFKHLGNVIIIPFELSDMWFSERVFEIKRNNQELYKNSVFWQQRNTHIMWGKTIFIEYIMNMVKSDNIFWIDAGLSMDQLLPYEYFPRRKLNQCESENIFNQDFCKKIVELSSEGMITLHHTVPNNAPLPEKYYTDASLRKRSAVVGGFFGGRVDHMKNFIARADQLMKKIIDNNELFGEESIYSTIVHENPEEYYKFFFDTFYHRDWGERYIPNKVIFSDFFEPTFNYKQHEDY